MSTPFNHAFIPVALLLLFSKDVNLDRKKILFLSFFAVLPDADALFLPHRAVFHNFIVVFAALLFFITAKEKKDVYGIIFFFLFSHILLDLFDGGIFIFYPVYDIVLYSYIELQFPFDKIEYVMDYGISNGIMDNGKGQPMISSENIAVVFLLSVVILLALTVKKWKRTGHPKNH